MGGLWPTGFLEEVRKQGMLKPSVILTCFALSLSAPAAAQTAPTPSLTYADLVDLGENAQVVVRARVKDQVALKPERAPGVAPGHVRLYIEAETLSLIAGNVPLGEKLRYLVDVPLTSKGKAPKLKKSEVLLFARPVAGRPGELQLVGNGAQQLYTPTLESRLRPVLTQLVSADAPPQVTRVADALAVEGTLVGESETQLFLDTENDGPVSITVVRRPNQPVRWGVSWSEIVDQSARPPRADTLEWYRLACSLPATLPSEANLTRNMRARELAARDYAYVVEQLGPCDRTL